MIRLIRFFTLCFLGVFLAVAVLAGFRVWINGFQFIPTNVGSFPMEILFAARSAIVVSLYTTLLLSLSYAARRNIPVLRTMLILWTAAAAGTTGLFLGVERLQGAVFSAVAAREEAGRAVRQPPTLGTPGLILSGGGTTVILLEDPGKAGASRLLAQPGRPLSLEGLARPEHRPPAFLSFIQEEASLLHNLFQEASRGADRLSLLLMTGLRPFLIYAGSLIFLLVSLRFVLDLSDWPLANLLLGALIFRGILTFEDFINLQNIQDLGRPFLEYLRSFLGESFPERFLYPLIFCCLGLIFIVCTLPARLARNLGAVPKEKK